MKTASFVVVAIVLGCLVLLMSVATAGQEQPKVDNRPLMVLTGAKSKVRDPGYYRITSADKLKELWRSHLGPVFDRGDDPVPDVDFGRCMVIALFEGASFNSRGLRIESVAQKYDLITVRFDDISYQTRGGANQVAPYAFVLLPKSENSVVLEKNVQQYLGEPPVWKEVARLRPDDRNL
jgi:hypothetical protein